ncbi:hypothetical protein GWK47_051078 [Chionoecetes opilio]|uniref:Uncharacterized protein n=1 Tax=Chionoecetes opilio TaxID=41210 RepID=A0A8J4YA92_CHIOP|nr:hypothetical protein GWK47_051078 [Chionoecetes opilio]
MEQLNAFPLFSGAAIPDVTTVAFLDLRKPFELANMPMILRFCGPQGSMRQTLCNGQRFLRYERLELPFSGGDVFNSINTKTAEHHSGSILSPCLFNIIRKNSSLSDSQPELSFSAIADDLALYCTGPATHQRVSEPCD